MKCLIIAYMLVCGGSEEKLNVALASKITTGWQPYEAPQLHWVGGFCQALVKYKCDE